MYLDMVNLAKVRRAVLHLLLIIAAFFIQELILSRIPILGVRAMILPIAVVAAGFWSGGVWGGIFGIIIGIFADMTLQTSSVTMTILFPVIGFFSGALPMFFMSRRLLSFFSLSTLALIVSAAAQMFRFIVFYDTEIGVILLTALLQLLWSLPFIFLAFFPCRAISKLDLTR